MEIFSQLLISAFRESLIWLPFVIGIGILSSYLKILDISIDGIIIINGIVAAIAWNITSSYSISFSATILASIALTSIVYSLIYIVKINPIMVGIIFSFAAHSISVIWVGESISLNSTSIFNNFLHIPLWLVALQILIVGIFFTFFKTYLGVEIRGFGANNLINTSKNPAFISYITYLLVGVLYGIGAFLYVHSEGNARSGGSFEFLIVALGSFLAFDKLFESNKLKISKKFKLFDTVVVKSIFGTFFFQIIIILVIFYTSNPVYWKLIFSAFLFFVLIPFDKIRISIKSKLPAVSEVKSTIVISNLNMSYKMGSENRQIFKNASFSFDNGINIVQGSNGTGKTTLLKLINGKLIPTSGNILLKNETIVSKYPFERDTFLIEQNPFNIIAPNLSLIENLSISLKSVRNLGIIDDTLIINELSQRLNKYNIEPIFSFESDIWYKPAITLSGGEAQILCIYMSILSEKFVLLFDEPTTGLDELNFKRLLAILKVLKEQKLIIITSHDKRLNEVCDNLYFIKDYTLVRN